MTLPRSAREVLDEHVTFKLECVDRLYLNLYVPRLQRLEGVAWFWTHHRGHDFASSALMAPMTKSFVGSIESFAAAEGVDLIVFGKGQRKEDVAKGYLRKFRGKEGVLFIGKAQEKVSVVRTERRRNPLTGQTYPWLVKSTSMVNCYYIYCVDRDFGMFFLKFCSYFPYNGKLCCNGHEYLKRQLARRRIAYEALDNGLLRCDDPVAAQQIANDLSAAKIDALLRKWLGRLPHPFTRQDRRAGFRYELSILQAEFSLTQIFDQPAAGRIFFEQIIRDNLDLGRPDRVQVIFRRRVSRRTPGRFLTRVITDGVTPSLHVSYKHSRIKQYYKEGRGLRTETTINDTYDFAIGRALHNLAALRQVGFTANRRLLDVQRISHDCLLGEEQFQQLHQPRTVRGQRAPALRFGSPHVIALLSALVLFRLLPNGFTNRELRREVASLLGPQAPPLTPGRMSYDLRRLRLHGLIQRRAKSHRYQVTEFGFRAALFLTRSYVRLLRPGMASLTSDSLPAPVPLRRALESVEVAIDKAWLQQGVAA